MTEKDAKVTKTDLKLHEQYDQKLIQNYQKRTQNDQKQTQNYQKVTQKDTERWKMTKNKPKGPI